MTRARAAGAVRAGGKISPPAAGQGPTRSHPMKNPLDSLWGTVLCGLALTAVLYYLVRTLVGG